MDDVQLAHHKRNEKVNQFLIDKAAELALTAADVAALQLELEGIIAKTVEHDTVADQDNTGVAITKNLERDELNISARTCIGFMEKHFTTIKDEITLRLINYNKSELENLSDDRFYKAARQVNKIATPIMASLILIKYTALLKTAFDTNLTEFNDLLGKPIETAGISSSFGIEVETDQAKAELTLDKIDIEMNLLEFDAPNKVWFNAYYLIRKIDDMPTHHGDNVSGSIDASGQKKVADITYDAAATVTLGATAADIDYTLRDNTGTPTGAAITVVAGTPQTKSFADLGPSGTQLWARNTSNAVPATYKVTFN